MKKELLSKKETNFKDLENSQPVHISKNEKVYSEDNTKDMVGPSLDKEIMRLYKQKHCQFELKGVETGQNEERLLNSLGSSSDNGAIWL